MKSDSNCNYIVIIYYLAMHGSFAWEKEHDQFYSVNSDKIQIVDGRKPGKKKQYEYKEMPCLNNASKFITHVCHHLLHTCLF